MHALLDGDIIVYRCAAVTKDVDEGIARWQAGEMINRILDETNADDFTCFLTGANNFRFSIYPEYKANRADLPKPRHWATIREFLVTDWNAKVTDGYEADDAMGMAQCASPEGTSVICSIDKDMLMIPGLNYNFVKQEMKEVFALEGMRWFYTQAILGDKVDNIPGYDGKMRSKIPQFLQPTIDHINSCLVEEEMYSFLQHLHYADVDLDTCLKCLWIWRQENDIWQTPMDRRTT